MIIVLMGVSGSGKTNVGKILARQLNWTILDADDYHPIVNIEKMWKGIPLNDEDRRPWLQSLRQHIDEACDQGESIVLACSALKHAYQEYLQRHDPEHIRFVYLRGAENLIQQRLAGWKGHFMNPTLLHSQLETLEPAQDAIQLDITANPEVLAAEIQGRLSLSD